MNKIQITDKYWITSDKRSWQVSTFNGMATDKNGKEYEDWTRYTWHGTFSQAVKSLSQRLLREAGKTSVGGLIESAREIEQIIENALKSVESKSELNINMH